MTKKVDKEGESLILSEGMKDFDANSMLQEELPSFGLAIDYGNGHLSHFIGIEMLIGEKVLNGYFLSFNVNSTTEFELQIQHSPNELLKLSLFHENILKNVSLIQEEEKVCMLNSEVKVFVKKTETQFTKDLITTFIIQN